MSERPAAQARAPRRRVDGVLLLDKPPGLTSNAALQRAKRLYAAQKAGHTGTLDPLASGLLPVCFGEATKFAQTMLDARKGYVATIRFGVATSTGDSEGDVIASAPVAFGRTDLEATLARFIGTISQVPPRHAALKYKGRAFYDYARKGIDIPRAARDVDIDALELVDWSPPDAVVRIACGKGTYVRVLAEDLATAIGSCAHLVALRRTASGPLTLEGASSLPALEALDEPSRDALLLPVDSLVATLPRLDIDAVGAVVLVQGRRVPAGERAAGRYRCYGPARFIGIVQVADGMISARRLLRPD
jgi:tRNA pseudouridine55 synthase